MEKINFQNGQAPAINDTNLNQLQTNIEDAINEVDEKVTEVDKKNNYSTEETVIGKWIDGKTLYRRVFTQTINATSWTKNLNYNIETLVDFKGYLKSNYEIFPLNMPLEGYGHTSCYYTSNTQTLRISCSYTINEITFILEYTKTTD